VEEAMRVTVHDVMRVIDRLYGGESDHLEDDIIYLRLYFGDYHCAVYIGLHNKYNDKDAEEQNLEVSFVPVEEDGSDINFHERTFSEALVLCNELQQALDWCAVCVAEDTDGQIVITFGRSINTSFDDIEKTLEGNLESELGTALTRLSHEFKLVAPIIRNFAEGKVAMQYVRKLLEQPHTGTH